jgi:hydroxymethylpyrimidine pyrophosphatase-like HAD family hydrolase
LSFNVVFGIMTHALPGAACDYDGTIIAHHGRIDEETIAALRRLRNTGRRFILVTGRILQDLFAVCPHVEMFDRVVAENGAVVYWPATREEKFLGEPPPERFVRALRERGVLPVAVGRVIVATWKPHETTVLEVIRDLGLELCDVQQRRRDGATGGPDEGDRPCRGAPRARFVGSQRRRYR